MRSGPGALDALRWRRTSLMYWIEISIEFSECGARSRSSTSSGQHGNTGFNIKAYWVENSSSYMQFCFVCLILYVPSTVFQLYRDNSSWVEPVLS